MFCIIVDKCLFFDFKGIRKKAQEIQKYNDSPHLLSRGGYELLEKKEGERNEKKEKEEMKRKKRKGKEGFSVEDRKKVKSKRSEENRIIPYQ